MGMLGRPAARAPINTGDIPDGIITSAKVAADVLTAADIAPNAVTASELATDAVETINIKDSTGASDGITTAKIATDAVTSAKVSGLVKGDVGLGNVDNTTDALKPVSTAATTALALKSPIANPTFTGAAILPSIKQQSSEVVTGTFTSKQMLLADTYSLTGNATINSDVVLGSLTGSDVVLLSDSTSVARTITGSGTLEIGEMTAKTPSAANIIAGGLTADADIQKNVDAALEASGVKKNVVVGFAHNRHSIRQSVPTAVSATLWNRAVSINKRYKDTHLHFSVVLAGHGKWSYPFYGTWGQVTTPSGSTHKRYDCSHYIIGHYGASGYIHWTIDLIMTPAECLFQSGNFFIDAGWDTQSGSVNKPFTTWNPNASDDARGYQKTSAAHVTELYLGEGQEGYI